VKMDDSLHFKVKFSNQIWSPTRWSTW